MAIYHSFLLWWELFLPVCLFGGIIIFGFWVFCLFLFFPPEWCLFFVSVFKKLSVSLYQENVGEHFQGMPTGHCLTVGWEKVQIFVKAPEGQWWYILSAHYVAAASLWVVFPPFLWQFWDLFLGIKDFYAQIFRKLHASSPPSGSLKDQRSPIGYRS